MLKENFVKFIKILFLHLLIKNVVDCKWVSKSNGVQMDLLNGTKAWFVAKELNQEEGVDYFETFNPVVRPTIIRLVLYCHLLWLGHSPT